MVVDASGGDESIRVRTAPRNRRALPAVIDVSAR